MCNDGKYIYASFYNADPKGKPMAVLSSDLKVVETLKFSGSIGLDNVKLSEYPDDVIFVKTNAVYKYRAKEQPVLKFDFYKYKDGKIIGISPKVKK